MLTYSFVDRGSTPLYEYLYRCIKNDILSGKLRPDEKLPSKRSFAENVGVSTITVENAYEQLMAEGYLYSIPKKGYYIADIPRLQTVAKAVEKGLGTTVQESGLCPQMALKAWPEEFSKIQTPEYYADFSSNQTYPDNFPFSIWSRMLREVMVDQREQLMVNSPGIGVKELRQAIATHLKNFRGMEVSPEQIVIGAGTEYLYSLIIQLLGFSVHYGVENPGYGKIAKIYQSQNVCCSYIHLDKQGVLVPELEHSGVEVIHLSPSHHFPTGIITPVSRRYELLEWASKAPGRYIIEDDYDSEFRMMGRPIPSLQSIDTNEKVLYMNTFSKSLSSTIRISYMVLPGHLLHRFQDHMDFYSSTVSNFEQYALAKFMEEGYFEKHINRMRIFYRTQRDRILACIREHPNASGFTIKEEDAGLHFLLGMDTGQSDIEVVRRAKSQGIRIHALGQYYYPERENLHMFVINYSSIPPERIQEAVSRLLFRTLE